MHTRGIKYELNKNNNEYRIISFMAPNVIVYKLNL